MNSWGVGFAGGGNNFVARGFHLPEGDVFRDGGVEKENVLADERKMKAEIGHAELIDGNVVNFNVPRHGIVKAKEEIDQGAFAGTAFRRRGPAAGRAAA